MGRVAVSLGLVSAQLSEGCITENVALCWPWAGVQSCALCGRSLCPGEQSSPLGGATVPL